MREAGNFNSGYGLFQGPAFLNDGIAGYPVPPADDTESHGSFVLDYPGASTMMTLSSNALYVSAYRSTAQMAAALGRPAGESAAWGAKADTLTSKINQYFWMPGKGSYGYLLHNGDSQPNGTLDPSEEASGLAFAILFGIASPAQAQSVMTTAHVQPYGITDVYPNFPRYSDAQPGRHNEIVWPSIEGFWADAAAHSGDQGRFASEVRNLAILATNSGQFAEVYNAHTGAVDGGWQTGSQ